MKLKRFAIVAAAVLATTALSAAGGVAELRLDAVSVSEILGAALPEPETFEIPGVGAVTIELGPVHRTRFDDGGIEAEVALRAEPLGWRADIVLRFVPRIDRRTGEAQLVLDATDVEGLPFELDLAAWVPPARLPRSVRWELEAPGARPLPVTCYVQGIEVEEDRLRLDLGLVAK